MRYIGSKRRIAKHILPIILARRTPNQVYIEPFCGGCNSLCLVDGPRIGIDINYYLIRMWQRIQEGWNPPQSVSEETYKKIKDDPDSYLPEVVGFVGFGCSFGGKWFGGYARDKTKTNYAKQSSTSVLKQSLTLGDVKFYSGEHNSVTFPSNSLIYCDPPYADTQGYGHKWDKNAFWDWCDTQTQNGHTLFVSEYSAPPHWKEVWSKTVFNTLNLNTGEKTGTEKLFTR